jgi:hypothetical protein
MSGIYLTRKEISGHMTLVECSGTEGEQEYVRVPELKLASEYHEDYGDVFWWRLPIEEPPHFGSPLNSDWDSDANYTHFSEAIYPKEAGQK